METIPAATGGTSNVVPTAASGDIHDDSYFVDGQGLYIGAAETFETTAEDISFGSDSVSMFVEARPVAGSGESFALYQGGVDALVVEYNGGSSLDVTLGGVGPVNFAGFTAFTDDWLSYGISIDKVSGVDSVVCISAPSTEVC